MLRVLGLLIFLSASVYAEGFGLCSCAPDFAVYVNGTNYSDSGLFSVVTDDGGQTYHIFGSIINDVFRFTLNVTTKQDTDISFDTSIEGDPTVAIVIKQSFLGGGPQQLDLGSAAIITDLSRDGHASALGSPFIQTTLLNGIVVNEQNTGCDLTGDPGFSAPCPAPSSTTQFLTLPPPNPFFPALNTLEMRIGFILSEGDGLNVTGHSTLNPVPEPATVIPMAAALLGLAGVAWRRRRLA